jgi:hypothetical protein
MPDTNIPDMTDAPPQDDTNTKTKPDVDTGPSSNPDPGPAPRDDTGTKPPENVSPRVTPPVTPPVSAPPADRNAPTSCTTCGPQTYVRTYGRTEPRVGSPSGIQPQTNSYDPKVKGKSIKEANLAAQIRDAKPSLTGHIEVDVGGGKKVKVPHRKAQEFLGSYHSKRTPNEKDEHEKAFRREIGG